jgi:gas vesicle protein
MKFSYLIVAAGLATFAACEKHESPEVKEKVNDALDRRPNEKLKDAGEDMKDAAEDAGKDIKDAAKDIKEDVKDATR